MLDDVLKGARGLSYTTGKFTMIADWRLAGAYTPSLQSST
jgi:hypothetical protein